MKNEIAYKKVSELEKFEFIIPSYQRGYRWTKNNIIQLFDDIYENDKECYLQPLIVNESKDKKWTVVDGQQRLTTIFIMFAVLNYIFESDNYNFFDLTYENRTFSKDFLDFLKLEIKKSKDDKNDKLSEDYIWRYWEKECEKKGLEKNKNLDFEYMVLAFCTILEKYHSRFKECDKEYLLNQILRCTFVWYPIEIKQDENMIEKEIQQFSKINMGKIPLTNAELIKVEVLNSDNFKNVESVDIVNKQFYISNRWHFIEKELHKKDFWAFIPHRNQYSDHDFGKTRIDYLFEFLMFADVANNSNNSDDNIENVVKMYTDKITKEDSYDLYNRFVRFMKYKEHTGEQIWSDIEDIFANLVDLYENDGRNIYYIGDEGLYNLLSFFVYYNSRKEKDETFLINYSLFHEMLKINRNERVRKIKKELERTMFPNGNFKEKIIAMRYGDCNDELREVLLLYNIIILFQSKGLGNRYNFLEHSKKNWTREHIFPQSLKKNNDDKTALENQKEILKCITSNLDVNGNIRLNKEFTLRYINLLYGKENSLKNNGDSQKCLSCPIPTEKRDNSGIINFKKDIDAIQELRGRKSSNKEEQAYLDDYCKKLSLIETAAELLEDIYVLEENKNITVKLKKENFYEDNKINILNHIKLNRSIFIENEITTHFDLIDFKNKDKMEILKNIKSILDIFECIPTETLKKLSYIIHEIDTVFKDDDVQEDENLVYSKDNDIENIEKKFREICKDIYEYVIENIDRYENNGSLIEKIFENSIKSINKKVTDFFEEKFDKLMADNSIGNMALLDSIVNGSKEIGNNLFSEKKIKIYKKSKEGYFIPLTTILTFSDIYTKNKKSDNYWMFESRCEYVQDILLTINNFLKGENKNGKKYKS